MKQEIYEQKIEVVRQQVKSLNRYVGDAPDQEHALLANALEELSASIEELEAAEKALQRKNQELTASRLDTEKAHQHYKELFDLAPDGYLITDEKGVILEANQAAETLAHVPQRFMLGKPLLVFVAEEDHEMFLIRMNSKRNLRQRATWDSKFQPRGKASFPVSCNVIPIPDVKGKIVGYHWLIRDISEVKKAEEALKDSETRYRRLFETAQDGILILDFDTGLISDVNPFLMEMLGYSYEDTVGKKIWEIGAFQDVEASKASLLELQNKGYVRYENLPLQRKDGRLISVEFVSNVYTVDHKKVIQCNIRDITARKLAEDANRKAFEESRKRQKEISALMEGARAVLEEHDFKGAAQTLFDSCKNLLGAVGGYVALVSKDGTENEVLFLDSGGLPCTVDPNLPMPIRGLREEAFRTGKPVFHNDFPSSDHVKFMPEGHLHLFNVLFAPLIIRGKTVGLLGLANKPGGFTEDDARIASAFSEITAIALVNKRTEEEREQLLKDLEQRVQERTADLVTSNQQLQQQIEQRKQAEEALRTSELKHRTVADNTYDWEWWRDTEGVFIYVSPSCKRITQYEREEFEKDPDLIFSLIHADDKPSFTRHMMEIEGSLSPGEIEFRILRPDGSYRWLAHACQPVFDEQGRFLGRRGSNRDITDRKEAEKSLKESENRHRTLVETMNEGLGIADERDVWTYVNEKFCRMLGYARDELIGRHVHELLDEMNRAIFKEQRIKQRKGEHEPYEMAWNKKDGSMIYTLVSPKPIFDEAGQSQGSFAVITDITKQKKTEESLHKALSEIRILKDQLEVENVYFRQESNRRHELSHIIGQSNAIKYVLYRAEQVAPMDTILLILGETGTGKDLIAAAIHQMSPRKDRPLVTVNCAALPANLIESELFGREKGAYTGADTRQAGRFEIANGSTLCLNEIGELPLEVQAKLLRVIEHKEFERLGSSHSIRVDTRIIATTNRNLEDEVRKSRFRQDLFYRLNVFPLTVPPLRQRKDDIPLLVRAFTDRFARRLGKVFTSINKEAMKALQDYDWPGNIRELGNVIERAVILCPGPVLQLADPLENSGVSLSNSLRTLEETEREQILKTLSATRWRINGKNGAAEILDLHPSTLRARMHKLGIRRPEINI